LKAGGTLIVNTGKIPSTLSTFEAFRVFTVDAGRIALRHKLGSRTHPIVNTAILGAFSRATGLVSIDAVFEAIRREVPSHREENVAAAREAYEGVEIPGPVAAVAR